MPISILSSIKCTRTPLKKKISNPISTGLVIWYVFNSNYLNGSNYLKNMISGIYDLKISGATITTNTYNCLQISSTGYAYIDNTVTNNSLGIFTSSTTYDMTICFWLNSTITTGWNALFDWYLNSNRSTQLYTQFNNAGALSLWIQQSNAGPIYGTMSANTWIMFAVVIPKENGTTNRNFLLYKITSSTPTLTTTFSSNASINTNRDTFYLGKSGVFGDPAIPGYVADFRIYNRILTSTELGNLYTAGPSNT